jgi:hypothetical protein
MLKLNSADLNVEILDPADTTDRARLGLRYGWGGYIWQVHEAKLGVPLLAGPEWPNHQPIPFNGQGLPESFRHAEFGTGRPLILEDNRGFIIGIGDVAPNMAGYLDVAEPCPWSITTSHGAIEFCTEQSGNGYACQLTRRIALDRRKLSSSTRLTNIGNRPLPLHWFAHPFFALDDRLITCGLPKTWGMNDNVGYELDGDHQLSFKRRFRDRDDGHFEQLIIGADTPLRATLSHPPLREIIFSTDFVPDTCPIWGNSNTWSIEPYMATELIPGTDHAWTLTYEFGPVV